MCWRVGVHMSLMKAFPRKAASRRIISAVVMSGHQLTAACHRLGRG